MQIEPYLKSCVKLNSLEQRSQPKIAIKKAIEEKVRKSFALTDTRKDVLNRYQ